MREFIFNRLRKQFVRYAGKQLQQQNMIRRNWSVFIVEYPMVFELL